MSVKRLLTAIVLAGLLCCATATSADWITSRGDAQRTGAQLNETVLSRNSVTKLRLLWSKKLEQTNHLSADPLIFGPLITHRGIKELVIEQNSAGTLWAIDADLGTTFWERRLGPTPNAAASIPSCARQPVAPTMSVPPFPIESKNPNNDDDFSDGNRPIYAFANDDTLYAIRPSTGADFSPPRRILPPDAHPIEISVIDGVVSLLTSPNCQSNFPDRTWTVVGDRLQAQTTLTSASANNLAPFTFLLDNRRVKALLSPTGELLLKNESGHRPLFKSKPLDPSAPRGLATAKSQDGLRFIYLAFANRLAAFTVSAPGSSIDVHPSWSTDRLRPLCAPVIANGVVYVVVLQQGSAQPNIQLLALDSATGAVLYTSAAVPDTPSTITNLALANGHIAFATPEALYCFGFPVDL